MALKAKLTKEELDKIPAETLAAWKAAGVEYVDEGESGFLLKVDEVDHYALQNAEELRISIDKERGQSKQARALMLELGDITPKQAKEAIAKLAERKNWKPDEAIQKQLAEEREAIRNEYQKQLEESGTITNRMKGQLEKVLIDAAINQAIVEAKGRSPKALAPLIKSSIKMVETKEGDYVARVVGPDGLEKSSRKSKTAEPMGVLEYVESMRGDPELAPLFEGTGVAGSGAQTRTNGAANGARFTMSRQEAADFPRFERMQAEAAKAGEAVQITP